MNHDPAMHAMLSTMWFLMVIPFVFVGIAVAWYRKTQSREHPDNN